MKLIVQRIIILFHARAPLHAGNNAHAIEARIIVFFLL